MSKCFAKFRTNDNITAITGDKSEQSIAEHSDTAIQPNATAPQPTVPHSSPYNQPASLSFLNGCQPSQLIQQGVNPSMFMVAL